MINSLSITNTAALAQQLTDKGVQLSPKPGSPLEDLIRGNMDVMAYADSREANEPDMSAAIADAANNPSHAQSLGTVVENYSRGIRRLVSKSRTVVRPIIDELSKDANVLVDAVVQQSTSKQVVVRKTPAIFTNTLLTTMTERYLDAPYTPVSGIMSSAKVTASEVRAMLVTKISRLDKELSAGFLSIADEAIMDLWYAVACDGEFAKPTGEQALFGFLLGRGIVNYKGSANVSARDLETFAARLTSSYGSALNNYNRSVASNRRAGMLVVGRDQLHVYVNGDVYKDFLKNGGTADMVLGSPVNGSASILQDGAAYAKAHKQYIVMSTAKNKANLINIQNTAVSRAFTSFINKMDFNGDEDDHGVIGTRVEVHARLRDILAARSTHETSDIYCFVRDLVSEVFYPGTQYVEFLKGIDSHVASNPELDAREAATLVVVDILVDAFADQVDCK